MPRSATTTPIRRAESIRSMSYLREGAVARPDKDKGCAPRLNIGFVTSSDPMDRRSWSGIYYFMTRALQKHCGEVRCLGPVSSAVETAGRAFNKASRLLVRKNYDYLHSVVLAKRYARLFKQKVSGSSVDLIFAPAASTEIAFLDIPVPIVYSSDTTFALVKDQYRAFSNLLSLSAQEADYIEGLAVRRASLATYPSEWAAQSALRDYQAPESKIRVIPYGANLEDEDIPPAETILRPRKSDECRLLFVGVDWARKGGDLAVETLLKLRALGIPAQLTVCGCVPPAGLRAPGLEVIPFLDKNDAAERQRLAELYLTSHFFLLPTRSECYGIVFCEANAFGLPVVTTNTGGVPGVITHGQNGFMLPLSAQGAEYAELISKIWRDESRYLELNRSSRRAFDERLNWDAWAVALGNLLARLF